MKSLYLFLIAVLFIIGIIYSFRYFYFAKDNHSELSGSICFGDSCFLVEIADTIQKREIGLMNRASLNKDRGMFFVFDKSGNYPFWMKNTLIPLDIIWLDEEYKVVSIAKNVQPCTKLLCPSINSNISAKYVLEINANLSQELNIEIGSIARFNRG